MTKEDELRAFLAKEQADAEAAAAAPAVPPVAAPAVPPTSYATTTATTPTEARREKLGAEKAGIRNDLFNGAVDSFGYGAARGATLGAVDRLVGIGTQAGESLASLNPGVSSEDSDAGVKARADYLAAEDKARKGNEIPHFAGEVVGSAVPMIASAGGAAPEVLGTRTAGQTLAAGAMSPAGRMAAQNFTAGAMNERSDNPVDQLKSGVAGAAVGVGAGKLADATIGKAFTGATDKEYRSLAKDIMVSEEGVSATPTARKQLVPKLHPAIEEVRKDPVLANAIRTNSASAQKMVQSKMQQLAEPRDGFYQALDQQFSPLTVADLHSGVFKAIKAAGDPKEKQVLEKFGEELDSFWIPKWQKEGMLTPQLGRPMAVDSLAVRDWTTQAQSAAADAMGTIDPTRAKKIQGLMAETAADIWQGHLADASRAAPDVVRSIKTFDGRYSALKSLDKVLGQRASKEEEQGMGIGKKLANASLPVEMGLTAAGALAGHTGPAIAGLGTMEVVKRLPKAGRYINDKFLVPIQEAAARGVPWATISQQALESGLPQGVARAIYDRTQSGRVGR